MSKFSFSIAAIYIVILITIVSANSIHPFIPGMIFMFECQVFAGLLMTQKLSNRDLIWSEIQIIPKVNFIIILILWIISLVDHFPEVNIVWFIFLAYVLFLIHKVSLMVCKYISIDQPRMKDEEKKRIQKN